MFFLLGVFSLFSKAANDTGISFCVLVLTSVDLSTKLSSKQWADPKMDSDLLNTWLALLISDLAKLTLPSYTGFENGILGTGFSTQILLLLANEDEK